MTDRTKKWNQFLLRFLAMALFAAPIFLAIPQKVAALKGYNAGFQTMEHPELLPYWLPDGTQVRQFISYDPSGGNNTSYFGTWRRYVDSNNETVIFDEYGPGCLYRQQMNIWHSGIAGSAHIKYYFDDEATPRLNMTMDAFFGYNQQYTAPFNAPLTYFDNQQGCCFSSANFAICYYPFPFQKRLKITVDRTADAGACWFQYTYLRYPTASEVQTWSGTGEDSAIVRNQWNNVGLDPKDVTGNVTVANSYAINNGSSATVLDLSGQGSVVSMRFTMNPWDSDTFTKTKLKIYWDNSGTPAVDMSLGSFFGGGGDTLGKTVYNMNFKNLFYGFDYTNKYFYCYWPMPYWSRARAVVENNSGKNITSFDVDIKYKPSTAYNYPSGQAGYFHAKRTLENASDEAYYSSGFEDFGRGKVVGLVMFSSGYNMDGDEFTYIDDTSTPSIHGDGTEDDHNQGWGGSNYQKPLWGGLINGYDGGYRTYYNDQYIYDRHIKITYEHSNLGSQTGQKTDFIIWYYKKDAGDGTSANLKLTDQLNVGDTASETAHSYTINTQTQLVTTNSAYDGLEQNVNGHMPCNDSGRYFKGFSQFAVAIDSGNNGVLLRRRLNRYNDNVQKADVYVDGAKVTEGPWYFCDLNPTSNQAFADSNFAIPKSYTQGKSSITVKVQYLDAKDTTNGINEYYYWVYSYVAVVLPTPTPTPSPTPSPTPEPTPAGTNLALGATASASSIWDANYTAAMANDNNLGTRWNSAQGSAAGEWLALDFGTARTFNAVVFEQETTWTRISSYNVQYWDGSGWLNAYTDGMMLDTQTNRFSAVNSSRIRLLVNSTTGNTPTIKEFRVYNEGGATATPTSTPIPIPTPTPGGHTEEFNSGTLNPAWSWVREDSAKWSLSASPGNMRITCQAGELYLTDNTAKNLLLRTPSAGDWSIKTKVTFNPSVANQQAGLLVYQDDNNYIKLIRCYNGANRVHFAKETGGTYTTFNEVALAATTVYLRITKSGSNYTGYYNTDGSENWTQVGTGSATLSNIKYGLADFAGPAADADFDWFDDGTAPTPTPTPAGHTDEFASGTLNGAWSWVREDSANWSLTARSGYMRIVCQGGDLFGSQNNAKNLLLRTAPAGDWTMTARMEFGPTGNYHQAGLLVYKDDDNYLKLSRAYSNGQCISGAKEIGGAYVEQLPGVTATSLDLKITKSGTTYTMYYSTDGGGVWNQVVQYSGVDFGTSYMVGLCSFSYTAGSTVNADFDWFDVR